ncbi:MAG: type II toxin-antitoxin system VapC family toxin [Acidobacteriaceae bacterium]
MSKVVLDASAILAFLYEEPGAEKLTDELLAEASISTVNITEAATKLIQGGDDPSAVWRDLEFFFPSANAFTVEQARTASKLVLQTRTLGLSLGDRACLALAISLKAPVWTADRSWKKLNIGVPVHLIR